MPCLQILLASRGGKSLVEESTATVIWEESRQEVMLLLIVIVRSVGVVGQANTYLMLSRCDRVGVQFH
jgi:hypothetical protein